MNMKSDAQVIAEGQARQLAEVMDPAGLPPGWYMQTAGESYLLSDGQPFHWDAMAYYSHDVRGWVWAVKGHDWPLPVPGCGKSDDALSILRQYAWQRGAHRDG